MNIEFCKIWVASGIILNNYRITLLNLWNTRIHEVYKIKVYNAANTP